MYSITNSHRVHEVKMKPGEWSGTHRSAGVSRSQSESKQALHIQHRFSSLVQYGGGRPQIGVNLVRERKTGLVR